MGTLALITICLFVGFMAGVILTSLLAVASRD